MDAHVTHLLAQSRAQEKAGDYAAALSLAQAALDQARALNDPEGLCGGHTHLANVHWRMGHYPQAAALAQEALRHASHIPDTVTAHHLLGLIASETGDVDAAEQHFHQAADLSRQIGYRLGLSLAASNLAILVYRVRGQYELALSTMALAHAINVEIGYPIWGSATLRADLHRQLGNRAEARRATDELAASVPPGSLFDGICAWSRGQLALDEDDLGAAEAYLAHARAVAQATGNPPLSITALNAWSRLHRLRGDWPAARAWADEAVAAAQRARVPYLEAEARLERSQVAREAGDAEAAEADLHAALDLLRPLRAAYHQAWAHFLLAALYHRQGRPEADAAWQAAAGRIAQGGYAFLLQQERALAFPLLAARLKASRGAARQEVEGLLAQLARVPPLPLHIAGLGGFAVRQGRRRLEARAWQRRKAGELVRFLLLQPARAAPHEAVLDALWPGQPPEAARAQLYQATSTTRRLLEPDLPEKFPSRYLQLEADRIVLLLPPGSTVDFEQLEADPLAESAAGWLDSELFPADRYADWAASARARVAQCQLGALLERARRHLATGQPEAALAACRRVLAREPWSEEAVGLGMQACVLLDDRPGALRLYQALADALQRDLQLTPRAPLRDLARSLRDSG